MAEPMLRRDFFKYLGAYVAALALPGCVGEGVAESEIEVRSSYMKDYEKKGTIEELRNHFRKKIKPKMPHLFKEMYDGTVMFGLDLENDQELLARVFDKIKKDGNFENVTKDYDYRKGEEDITFYNIIHRDYSLKGNFNGLEITLLFDTDPEFTKITGIDFWINNLNLDKDGKNHPDGVFNGDFRGDLFEEYGGFQSPYLKIFTHLQGDKVDIGGLRTLLTQALNKQDLIQKDFSLIRAYLKGDIELEVSKSKPFITEDVKAFFSLGKKK